MTFTSAGQPQESFEQLVKPFITRHCMECHFDAELGEAGLDLARFHGIEAVGSDLPTWKVIYDQIDTFAMPPRGSDQPSRSEREAVLKWIEQHFAGAAPENPGRSVIRRLTRLEYNNTVRDLFGLSTDVFMFPERLPLNADRFDPALGRMPERLEISIREYGQKYPVLLPQAGLPGDGRAEHGFRNRGDAMNVSPLLLEEYVSLAGQIVSSSRLPTDSRIFRALVTPPGGENDSPLATSPGGERVSIKAVPVFSPDVPPTSKASGSTVEIEEFQRRLEKASSQGFGGVFTGSYSEKGGTLLSGTSIVIDFGKATLDLVPTADIWSANFSTAEEPSRPHLLTNQRKTGKRIAFRCGVASGDKRVQAVGFVMPHRRGHYGNVSVTVRTERGAATAASELAKDSNVFFGFLASDGDSIREIEIDGSGFSGDHILFDDLAFVLGDRASSMEPFTPNSKVATEQKDERLIARERLSTFLPRAFRRPIGEAEVERYAALFDHRITAGKSFEDSMRAMLQAVLASPSFLYLAEPNIKEAGRVRPLNDFELASRLSYFLWSSMPDDELFRLARERKLSSPDVLDAQVVRMLRDPKARELSESFAVQWLRLDQVYTARPDRELFSEFYAGPQGKGTLHSSLLVEPLLLFETILTEDRSVLELIDADYTWVNQRLASLYGFGEGNELLAMTAIGPTSNAQDDPPGRELPKESDLTEKTWVRVPLPDRSRGGVITMAGPLTVTSLPTRTSPVKRGAWLLETILNRPPKEPKVAVPPLDRKDADDSEFTVRQKLELHRADMTCAVCHDRIDPPGFAMEQFDAIGRLRQREGSAPVDATGVLPDGRSFNGAAEFKEILTADGEFLRAFTEHLLSYALGRKLEWNDMPAVDVIVKNARRDNFRLSKIVSEIVRSDAFRSVRNELPGTANLQIEIDN